MIQKKVVEVAAYYNWERVGYFQTDIDRNSELNGKFCAVFIDGKRFPVEWRAIAVPYDDQGHTYEAHFLEAFITFDVFGVPWEVRLYQWMRRAKLKTIRVELN